LGGVPPRGWGAGAPEAAAIVKGLRLPDWPADGWQALHRLAMMLCRHCAVPR